jgi:hypothetical protein
LQAKAELEDIESEHQREMEGLLENVRQLQKELKLYITLIGAYIPDTYVDLIEKYVCWNDENGEWQVGVLLSFLLKFFHKCQVYSFPSFSAKVHRLHGK